MPLLVWWATDVCMNANCFSSQLPSIDLRTDALYTFRGYNPHPLSPFHSYHIHFHPTPSWSALSTPRHHPVGIAPQNILSYLQIQSKLKWNWPIRFHSLGGSIRMEKALRDKCECQVCGATAKIGFHYGAITCYKCKAFFRSKQVCNFWPQNIFIT